MCRNIAKILYHGTISEITAVDVTAGRSRKDFGRGFYMSPSRKQAIGMMHKKYREAVRRSRNRNVLQFQENLYEIRLDEERLKDLNIKIFEHADLEWLDFVLMCREHGGVPHDYDLVIGATVADTLIRSIRKIEWR